MKLGFNLEKLRNISVEDGFNHFLRVLSEKIRKVVLIVAILTSAYAVYIWYGCLYKSEWSQDKVRAYIDQKNKGIIFKKDRFDETIKFQEQRKTDSGEKMLGLTDIFSLNK